MRLSSMSVGATQGEGQHSTAKLATICRWDRRFKAHKQLRREIAALELLHREMQKDKAKMLKQERREKQEKQERAHTTRKAAARAQAGLEQEAGSVGTGSKQAEQHTEQRRSKWARYAAEWKKVEKQPDHMTVKQMQARIRQLASETAASFDFDVAQAAEIADGKSRWRLPRVFSTGALETPEQTVTRYWQRATTQPVLNQTLKTSRRAQPKG